MSSPIQIQIYSDGSYFEKQKTGGWGAVIFKKLPFQEKSKNPFQEILRVSGWQKNASSLEMELKAAFKALQQLEKYFKTLKCQTGLLPYHITLFTDSRVLLEGLNQKIQRWRQTQWINKSGNPVKYQSLWESLDILTQQYQVNWRWVKGHNNNFGNTLADQLAREALIKNMI